MPPTPDLDRSPSTPIRTAVPASAAAPRPSPNHPLPSPFTPTPGQNSNQPPGSGDDSGYATSPIPGPPFDEPPTSTSVGERARKRPPAVTSADVAKTIASLLVVLAGIGGWLAARSGRHLRAPSEEERDEVALPLASILVRHVGAQFLTEDMNDAVRCAAGVAGYVQTTPLRSGPKRRPAPGEIPDDLEDEPDFSPRPGVDLEPI